VPSFGPWGFNIGIKSPQTDSLGLVPDAERVKARFATHMKKHKNLNLKYLEPELIPKILIFERDYRTEGIEVNRLENQMVVRYYEDSWRIWD
jgi:predicted membrane-bound spermidine synthase